MIRTSPVYFDTLLNQLSSDLALLLVHSLVWSLPIIVNSPKTLTARGTNPDWRQPQSCLPLPDVPVEEMSKDARTAVDAGERARVVTTKYPLQWKIYIRWNRGCFKGPKRPQPHLLPDEPCWDCQSAQSKHQRYCHFHQGEIKYGGSYQEGSTGDEKNHTRQTGGTYPIKNIEIDRIYKAF